MPGERPGGELPFARRVLIAGLLTLVLLALALVLARHPEVPLLLFGGILGAVFLDALAWPLRRALHAPRPLAVGIAALVLVASGVAGAWLIGPQLYEQGAQLADRLPQLLSELERRVPPMLADTGLPLRLPDGGYDWSRLAPYVFGSLGGFFSTTVGILTGALATFALSIFLALQPERYRDGAVLLLPRGRRPRLCEVLDAVGSALRWWLVGRISAMAIVALLTAIGLKLLGVQLALSLALLAGLLTFVPYVGPLLAALPAVLVGLADSTQQALLVAALYWGIQLVENYVVTPVVQGRAVSLPPALLLIAQIALGVLLGGLGLLLSTPITVAVMVFVQMLYVQDVLGEPVQVLGETGARSRRRRRAALRGDTHPTRT